MANELLLISLLIAFVLGLIVGMVISNHHENLDEINGISKKDISKLEAIKKEIEKEKGRNML